MAFIKHVSSGLQDRRKTLCKQALSWVSDLLMRHRYVLYIPNILDLRKIVASFRGYINHAKVPQSFAMFYEEWAKRTVLSEFRV